VLFYTPNNFGQNFKSAKPDNERLDKMKTLKPALGLKTSFGQNRQ
jgi:hypothetical protein